MREVRGEGTDTVPKLGTQCWPGKNNALFIAASDDEVACIKEAIHEIRKTHPRSGVKGFILPMEEDPARTKEVETRWKSVCGEATTLQQVLAARRETRGSAAYERGSLGRFMAGAAFVFLQELPPAQDLALAGVKGGWQPVLQDLARLDRVDDVDLGLSLSSDED